MHKAFQCGVIAASFAIGLASTFALSASPGIDATTDSLTIDRGGLGSFLRCPIVIGHRGASGYRPEHTLESYKLAIEMGADYIEPDLVATKDGVLIARHEPNLIATTDIATRPEFASRKRKAIVDGVEEEGFFASDFTLAEIKTIRAVQAFAEREQAYNGQFAIPTFEEIIVLAQSESRKRGRNIGIYPETKHPTYHQDLGLPLEDRLLVLLSKYGWNSRNAPVFIQSFEQSNLKSLRKKTAVRLIQLVDADDVNTTTGAVTYAPPYDRPYDWTRSGRPGTFGDLLTPAGLDEVQGYADGIGPWKRFLVGVKARKNADGTTIDVNVDGKINDADYDVVVNTEIVRNAKQRGLLVHAYTFRNEPRRLARSYFNDPGKEYRAVFELGVDGVFSDFPDTGVAARDLFVAKASGFPVGLCSRFADR
jgi:glycerophosphoryl diester phosphodiesterase